MNRRTVSLLAAALGATTGIGVGQVIAERTAHRSAPVVVNLEPSLSLREPVPPKTLRPARRRAHPRPRRSEPYRTSRSTSRVELLDVTAYCATGSRTASGVWPHAGMAAGNRWPFGTRLRVPGYGVVVIADRIGWGSDLDLYFGDRGDCAAAADNWGRRRLEVEVLR